MEVSASLLKCLHLSLQIIPVSRPQLAHFEEGKIKPTWVEKFQEGARDVIAWYRIVIICTFGIFKASSNFADI